jgi:hypothetical protein
VSSPSWGTGIGNESSAATATYGAPTAMPQWASALYRATSVRKSHAFSQLRKGRQEAVQRADKMLPSRFGVDDPVIAAFKGNKPCSRNESRNGLPPVYADSWIKPISSSMDPIDRRFHPSLPGIVLPLSSQGYQRRECRQAIEACATTRRKSGPVGGPVSWSPERLRAARPDNTKIVGH